MTLGTILTIILVFILVGVALHLVNTRITQMDGTTKTILNYLVWGLLIIWAFHLLGIWDLLNVRVTR